MRTISTTRRVLAVVAVTTALCADHAAVAAPAARPQTVEIGQFASRLVSRLAQNFRQAMPMTLREPARGNPTAESPELQFASPSPAPIRHVALSPFQFRLPPPAV